MQQTLIDLVSRVAALEAHRSHDNRRIEDREDAMEQRQDRMQEVVRNNRRLVHIALGMSMAAIGIAGNMSLDETGRILATLAKIAGLLL